MKSERLLSALLLLQAQGRLSEREMAERLEVSQRTAHRDMEALCAAGIPLIAHRGARGGWELEKGWRTRVPGFDDAELWGLLMAQPGSSPNRRWSHAARRAFDKLMASMPAAMRAQAASIQARLHIDATGWRMTWEDLSALPVVQDAVARDCRLTFLYTRSDGTTGPRTVDPLGLVSKQAAWYLVARRGGELRTYRISRMRDAVALAVRFERPGDFDLAAHWKRNTDSLGERRQQFHATLALSPEGAVSLAPWCAMTPVESHPADRSLREGWRVYVVDFDSLFSARFVTLGLGPRALALAPEELCQVVAAELAEMTAGHLRMKSATQ